VGNQIRISLILFALVMLSCSPESSSDLSPLDAEMVFWEHQSWEVGGGRSRLTIWADGRSEVMVVPDASFRANTEKLQPRDGWAMKKSVEGPYFVRKNVFPEDVARDKFNRGLEAGIHRLKSFTPDYLDGSGTLVGIQIAGELREIVIPMFLERHRGSQNHKRFVAVSKILSGFDKLAFDIKN
jgi:hypothetical protein